ncbi:6717_t:CDS:2, partial [Dentiscutata erythropus]
MNSKVRVLKRGRKETRQTYKGYFSDEAGIFFIVKLFPLLPDVAKDDYIGMFLWQGDSLRFHNYEIIEIIALMNDKSEYKTDSSSTLLDNSIDEPKEMVK